MEPNNTPNNSGKKVGPIIGALIIVILLVVAALYAWGHRLNKEAGPASDQVKATENMPADNTTAGQNYAAASAKMSSSDDVDSLSKDVDSVDSSSNSSF